MNINWRLIFMMLVIFLTLEILSFGAVFYLPIFIILVALTAVLTAYRLEYGLLAVLAELLVGSMGHLFYLDVGAGRVPLRIGMFAAFFGVFLLFFVFQLIKERSRSPYWLAWRNFPGRRIYSWLAGFVTLSLCIALLRGNDLSFIFKDFNAWLYFALVFPAVAVYGQTDQGKWSRLQAVFLAGAVWLSLKTLFILFIFAHNTEVAAAIYYWLRRILGGEVTMVTAGWPRVFIQGQIFSAIAFFLAFWLGLSDRRERGFLKADNLLNLGLCALFFSTVLISLSRSFWVGLAVAVMFSGLALWRLKGVKSAVAAAGRLLVVGVLGFFLVYLVVIIPYNEDPALSLGESLVNRVASENEPALASRWSLLPVLGAEIRQDPIFGRGFGATVAYTSSDPRVLSVHPDGRYTTYAFEWGYLDLWLKLGLFGLGTYLLLIFTLIKGAWHRTMESGDFLYLGLAAGLVFLGATNFFTPYLNHPLGIGCVVLGSCLILANKVY